MLAPFDPDVRRTALLHRGARPQARDAPEWLVPLGPTIGWPSNGAVSNLAHTPYAVATLRRELEAGDFDVVHVHEPVAPVVGWDALTAADAPLVGTFHCYSESAPAHAVAAAARRAAQAQPPVGADRGLRRGGLDRPALLRRPLPRDPQRRQPARGRGGRDSESARARARRAAADRVRRPGRRAQGPARAAARLRGAAPPRARGADRRGRRAARSSSRCCSTPRASGRSAASATPRSARRSRRAHVLCAPSLGGESFGMVLTEAFAAGTPVVASDIAGYRGVVTDGRDGLLVPRGDATRLAETLRDLALEPARTVRMGEEAARSAERYAWPRIAAEVTEVYEEARAVEAPRSTLARAAVRVGMLPPTARGSPRAGCRRWSRRPRSPRAPPCASRGAGCSRSPRSPPRAARCWRSSGSACARSARRCSPRARRGCSWRSG